MKAAQPVKAVLAGGGCPGRGTCRTFIGLGEVPEQRLLKRLSQLFSTSFRALESSAEIAEKPVDKPPEKSL